MQHEHREPRLLAIDDSDLIHRLLRARLKHERLEIHSATSGQTGVVMARTLRPDVILLDVDLPGMDGFAVLEALKSDAATSEIPVIFVSGNADPGHRVRGLDMGALDYVSKPFDVPELRARVRAAIRTHRLITMLAQRAQLDGLTGLWNRAYLDERLAQEIAEAQRHRQSLSLILGDLDHFKELNDTYGHPFGDQVLEDVARVLSQGRQTDVHCRYGGEEFAVIAPNTAAEESTIVAERLRQAIAGLCWSDHRDLTVTMSLGVADLTSVLEPTVAALLAAADGALYAAKRNGRNQVATAPPAAAPMRLSA